MEFWHIIRGHLTLENRSKTILDDLDQFWVMTDDLSRFLI